MQMNTAAQAAATTKPFSIHLIGPALPIFQELCVHVRNGYVVSKDAPIELFQNGNASIFLLLGNPDEVAIAQAKESAELSVAKEEAQYRKDVQDAAKRLVEQDKRDELKKRMDAEQAAHEKAVAKLKKELEAELAKLAQ
jgi:hypothetical protein